jgi:hypothetical protein
MTFLDKLTEPTKSTLDCIRMASILRVNDVIELVRELRDAPILPEEQPEQIQKIMTALSQLKAGLLLGGDNG